MIRNSIIPLAVLATAGCLVSTSWSKDAAAWILNPPDLETVVLDNTSESGGYNVHTTSDGGYIVAGCTTRKDHHMDLCVWKYRADLSLDPSFGKAGRWIAGSKAIDQAIDAIEIHAPDGKPAGFLVIGYAGAGDDDFEGCGYHGKNDIVLARLTNAGQPDPAFGHGGIRLYGGSEDDMMVFHTQNFSEPGDHLVQTDGGYLASAMTRSKDGDLTGIAVVGWQEAQDAMIFKVDARGEFVSAFGDHGILRIGNKPGPNMGKRLPHDYIWSLKKDPSGGFVGSGFHFGIGLPIDGTMIYSPGNHSEVGDNTSESVSDHKMDGWMFRFDEHGHMRSDWGDHGFVYLGGSRQEKLYDIAPTDDGGYIVCGRTASSDLEFARPGKPDEFDVVVMKVGKNGKLDHSFAGSGVCFLGGGGDQASRVLMYEGDVLCLATSVEARPQLPLPANYYHQAMVIRLSPKGEPRAYWSLGKEGQDWPVGMAIDREGRLVIVGFHDATKTSEADGEKKGGRKLMLMRFRPTVK
jgi:uncharacterized delta-60 repeat protein